MSGVNEVQCSILQQRTVFILCSMNEVLNYMGPPAVTE